MFSASLVDSPYTSCCERYCWPLMNGLSILQCTAKSVTKKIQLQKMVEFWYKRFQIVHRKSAMTFAAISVSRGGILGRWTPVESRFSLSDSLKSHLCSSITLCKHTLCILYTGYTWSLIIENTEEAFFNIASGPAETTYSTMSSII